MQDLRLVALDLDGTTVRRDGSIGRRTRAVIAQARQRGVTVCVATGRTYESADAMGRKLGAGGPIICCDGALVRERQGGPVRFAWPIETEAVGAVCAAAEAAGGGWAAYTERGRVFGGAERPRLSRALLSLARRPWLAWQRLRLDRAQPTRHGTVAAGEAVYKMVAWGLDPGVLAERLRGQPLAWPSGVGRRAVEIVAAGVSKGLALSALADALGVPRASVAAFGDGLNDLEMLAYAGHGVAMASAPERVRAAADAVTGTVEEEGFARALAALLAGGAGAARPTGR